MFHKITWPNKDSQLVVLIRGHSTSLAVRLNDSNLETVLSHTSIKHLSINIFAYELLCKPTKQDIARTFSYCCLPQILQFLLNTQVQVLYSTASYILSTNKSTWGFGVLGFWGLGFRV